MKIHPSPNQSNKKPSNLSPPTDRPTQLLALTSSITVISAQAFWNKIAHSKTLVLCLLTFLFVVGVVIWNQASEHYASLAITIFQNQRLARENQQFVEKKLQTWQKAASLQPNSNILHSEIQTLLPSPN